MELRQYLDLMSLDRVKKLFALLPHEAQRAVSAHPLRGKALWIDAIVRAMSPKHLPKTLAALSEAERLGLAYAAHLRWEGLDNRRFEALTGEPLVVLIGSGAVYMYQEDEHSIMRLFLHANSAWDPPYWIPEDLADTLRALLPEPPPLLPEPLDEAPGAQVTILTYDDDDDEDGQGVPQLVPTHTHHAQEVALLEVVEALALASAGKLAFTAKRQEPTTACVRAMGARLVVPELLDDLTDEPAPLRAAIWPMLIKAAGYLNTGRGEVLTRRGTRAMQLPPHEVLRELWVAWQSSALDEVTRLPFIHGAYSKDYERARRAPAARREAILELMRKLPAGRWVTAAQLVNLSLLGREQTQLFETLPWVLPLKIGPTSSASFPTPYDELGHIHISWLNTCLVEIASTLGLLDVVLVAPDRISDAAALQSCFDVASLGWYDGLYAVRLTELGAWCLGMSAPDWAPEVATHEVSLHVQADRSIIAMTPAPAALRAQLDLFCDAPGDHRWTLSRASLLAASEAGHDLATFRALLIENADAALPNTIDALFDEAIRRAGLLRLGPPSRLITVGDPALAVELAHHKKLAGLCALAGEGQLIVEESKLTKLRAQLRKLGYVLPLS